MNELGHITYSALCKNRPNKALHRTVIALRSIAAGELCRWRGVSRRANGPPHCDAVVASAERSASRVEGSD